MSSVVNASFVIANNVNKRNSASAKYYNATRECHFAAHLCNINEVKRKRVHVTSHKNMPRDALQLFSPISLGSIRGIFEKYLINSKPSLIFKVASKPKDCYSCSSTF